MRNLWLIVVLLTGCASDRSSEISETLPHAPGGGVVEVTNHPLEYLVTRIGGPRTEVRFRSHGANDPAEWRPGAEDVVAMQDADLIVVNGAGYEPWLDDVSLSASRVVDTTRGVRDRLLPVEDAVTHSHGPGGEHAHVGTAFTTWLDLSLFLAQADAVTSALQATWPQHASEFARRSADLRSDLEALDAELASTARALAGSELLFSHPVYPYLQARYGLVGTSVHWEPDLFPDEQAWAELRRRIETRPVRAMIWEQDPVETTRRELDALGIEVVVFDPCSTRRESGDFLQVMRANVERLRSLADRADLLR